MAEILTRPPLSRSPSVIKSLLQQTTQPRVFCNMPNFQALKLKLHRSKVRVLLPGWILKWVCLPALGAGTGWPSRATTPSTSISSTKWTIKPISWLGTKSWLPPMACAGAWPWHCQSFLWPLFLACPPSAGLSLPWGTTGTFFATTPLEIIVSCWKRSRSALPWANF